MRKLEATGVELAVNGRVSLVFIAYPQMMPIDADERLKILGGDILGSE